jgi:hypothetical protein
VRVVRNLLKFLVGLLWFSKVDPTECSITYGIQPHLFVALQQSPICDLFVNGQGFFNFSSLPQDLGFVQLQSHHLTREAYFSHGRFNFQKDLPRLFMLSS